MTDVVDSDDISVVPDSLPIAAMRMDSSEGEEAPLPDDAKEKVAVEMKQVEWMNKYDSPSDLQSTQAVKKRQRKATTKGYATFWRQIKSLTQFSNG